MDLPATEQVNPRTRDLDRLSPRELVAALQAEDRHAVEAAARARDAIAALVERAHAALAGGGRLVLVGAGTSGRLAVLEASECPPTFSTSPDLVVALMAGGERAFTKAVEGAEDDGPQGGRDVRAASVTAKDLVIGVTASGRTPYVLGALAEARARGAPTALMACSPPADASVADALVLLETGPEALAGSTRLKAGTACKVALNAVTTGAMVLLGKVHGNLMVDVAPTNAKLRERAKRIVAEIAAVPMADAARWLERSGNEPKTAVVMARFAVSADGARERLRLASGSLRRALEARS
jgi:N-acetylmuramic acid 6-phosphate etherase